MQIKDELIPHYIKFAKSIIVAKKYQPIIDRYFKSGISKSYLLRISNIANKIYHAEQKRVQRQKTLTQEKVQKMTERYLQSRIKLSAIEAEVSKFLAENNLKDNVLYNHYMNYGRECYKAIRKYSVKDPPLL
jgi:hypothetical protein